MVSRIRSNFFDEMGGRGTIRITTSGPPIIFPSKTEVDETFEMMKSTGVSGN
jgi:hypothetical protein